MEGQQNTVIENKNPEGVIEEFGVDSHVIPGASYYKQIQWINEQLVSTIRIPGKSWPDKQSIPFVKLYTQLLQTKRLVWTFYSQDDFPLIHVTFPLTKKLLESDLKINAIRLDLDARPKVYRASVDDLADGKRILSCYRRDDFYLGYLTIDDKQDKRVFYPEGVRDMFLPGDFWSDLRTLEEIKTPIPRRTCCIVL